MEDAALTFRNNITTDLFLDISMWYKQPSEKYKNG